MSTLAELSARELASLFEAGKTADEPFTHRDHVRVAWALLRRYPPGLALHHMTVGVETLARQRGLPDLYHSTITTIYVLAIAERIGASEDLDDFEVFASEHPELLAASRQFLLGFYTEETLDSARARQEFVLPERLPTWRALQLTFSS